MCYNQFRAVHADIKETQTMNLKAFAEQENESSPSAA